MGAALAMAAAGVTGVSATAMASQDGKVHCYGVNKCKGHNDCKSATNACKGMASCKGQGFVVMSRHACEAIGGKPKDK
ncbi:MAG: hypothetical protein D6720_13710 [Gammaproteobacteria bacterium]|nr:MAG: hypothetical protein D6720_13710 [Gammaproteobacteria bacterium]